MSDTFQRSQVSAKPKDALPPNAARTGTAALARRGPLAEAVRSGPPIGPADDRTEFEASRMAEAVMSATPFGKPYQSVCKDIAPDIQAPVSGHADQPVHPRHQAAAPEAVSAVSGPGRGLTKTERAFFEPRFARDLSAVRIHDGPRAEAAARSIGARAYTFGRHIAFAPGHYDRDSGKGQRLLAHELTHTLQPGGVIRREAPPGVRMPERTETAPPTDESRMIFFREALDFAESQSDFFLNTPDRDLAGILDLLRPAVANGLEAIAQVSSATTQPQQLRDVYTRGVDRLIRQRAQAQVDAQAQSNAQGSGTVRTVEETRLQLYAQHRQRILPFALPDTRAAADSTQLLDELTEPLPDRPTREQRARRRALDQARNNMKLHTGSVEIAYRPYFDTRGGTMTQPLEDDTSVRFADNVPANLRRGLQSTAALMDGTTLTGNMTVTLLMDLTDFGGLQSTYRFTRLDLGTLGTELWVERLSDVFREGLLDTERTEMMTRFTGFGFRRRGFGSGASSEFDEVLIGLAQVPDAQLSSLGNLTFRKQGASAEHPRASAQYDIATHTIEIFDLAFESSQSRQGSGAQPISGAASAVIHEVGHALDLRSLQQAGAARQAAERAMMAEFATGERSYGTDSQDPAVRRRYSALESDISDAQRDERAANARSGARVVGDDISDNLRRRAREPAFRRAVRADGGNPTTEAGFPTTYPDPDSFWQEYFAEAYAMYRAQPDVLAQMRPHVFAFMESEFPTTGGQGGSP